MNAKEAIKAALPKGKRVHHMRDGAPRCGGGRHGKRGLWQTEMSDVTCRRCLKLAELDRSRETREGSEAVARQKAQKTTKEEDHR